MKTMTMFLLISKRIIGTGPLEIKQRAGLTTAAVMSSEEYLHAKISSAISSSNNISSTIIAEQNIKPGAEQGEKEPRQEHLLPLHLEAIRPSPELMMSGETNIMWT